MGFAFRVLFYTGLDLSDTPGAGSAKVMSRAAAGIDYQDVTSRFIILTQKVTGAPVDIASQILSMVAGLAAILGAGLAGGAVLGREGCITGCIMASFWSMTTQFSILSGADPLILGLSWMAVGLCWLGMRTGILGLPIVFAGSWLGVFAISIKSTALSAVLLSFIGFGLLPKKIWHWPFGVLAFLLGVLYARDFISPTQSIQNTSIGWSASFWDGLNSHLGQHTNVEEMTQYTFGWGSIVRGWENISGLLNTGYPEGLFEQLVPLSFLSAILPGKKWLSRLTVGLASVVCILLISDYLGPKLRPRYLVVMSIGLIVMLGILAVVIMNRIRSSLRWLIPVCFGVLLASDTLAYMSFWGITRSQFNSTLYPVLPTPPEAYSRRYKALDERSLRDLSAYGIIEVLEAIQNSEGGVAIPPLRDSRHWHLISSSISQEKPWVFLEPDCCNDRPKVECGQDLVTQISNSGMIIMLPTQVESIRRTDQALDSWMDILYLGLSNSNRSQEIGKWLVLLPEGKDQEVPCTFKYLSFRNK